MTAETLVAELEQVGVRLKAEGDKLKLEAPAGRAPSQETIAKLRENKLAVLEYLRSREKGPEVEFSSFPTPIAWKTEKLETGPPPIPAGAVLIAPRYDGYGRPLKNVPTCWCCSTPWRLDQVKEWKDETIAWLKPSCGCLNVPQALSCCGLCVEHCRCDPRRQKL